MKKATLVIMAAGLGSRFKGGLKQLEPVGMNGEILMEYSIYDALEAGFNKVVFVIRKSFAEEFIETIGRKIEKKVECAYVYQELDNLPIDINFKNRTKPWGTGQAILTTKDVIDEPFCVINADDYYGKDSFVKMYNFLTTDLKSNKYCMVGYLLKNTLSDNGGVSRGICVINPDNKLIEVKETYNIAKVGDIILSSNGVLKDNSIASMNMWGFHPSIFDYLKDEFIDFLKNLDENDIKSEFLIPVVVDKLLKSKKIEVEVLNTDAKWLGITYKEDKEIIQNKFKDLYMQGVYKDKLF